MDRCEAGFRQDEVMVRCDLEAGHGGEHETFMGSAPEDLNISVTVTVKWAGPAEMREVPAGS
ncbi:MAG TPA: hypothetical protein VGG50_11450 [Streptosporangiaceae bacterium]|jgi:hypothetical protein